jgi:hypothetical protein
MKGNSLRAKVFVLFAGATLLIVVPTLLLIARAVERKVYADAARDLALADSALKNAWELRGQTLVSTAQLRAFEPGVADAWGGRRWKVLDRRLRGGDDKAVVLAADTDFAVLRGTRVDSAALAAAAVGSGTSLVASDSGLLRLAVAEVWREETARAASGDSAAAERLVRLGVVGIGSRVTAAGLRKESASAADVALMVGDSVAGTTLADSVLGDSGAARLAGVRELAWERPQLVAIGSRTYFTRVSDLPARGPRVSVLYFRPVADELRIAKGIQRSLFGIGFVALLLAWCWRRWWPASWRAPRRRWPRPRQRLARGDYDAPLPRDSGDEIGQLARAFGEMRARHRRARAAAAQRAGRDDPPREAGGHGAAGGAALARDQQPHLQHPELPGGAGAARQPGRPQPRVPDPGAGGAVADGHAHPPAPGPEPPAFRRRAAGEPERGGAAGAHPGRARPGARGIGCGWSWRPGCRRWWCTPRGSTRCWPTW